MLAAKDHIIVRVDVLQKETMEVSGIKMLTGKRYNVRYTERNPVLATIVDGLGEMKTGLQIVCNYSYFGDSSAIQITNDLFSLPLDEQIFGIVGSDGELNPVFGNMIVDRVPRETFIDVPPELIKEEFNRGFVVKGGGYQTGDFVFWQDMSDYQINYVWNGEDRTRIKVHKSEIIGLLKK